MPQSLKKQVLDHIALNHLSRSQFAAQAGVSTSYVHKLLAGQLKPSEKFIAKVRMIVGAPAAVGPAFNFDLRHYPQADTIHIAGEYQSIRPSFREPEKLNCYITSISWDDELQCLVFEEKNNELAPCNTGYVSIPHFNRIIYLLTTDKGNFRLAALSDAYEEGLYYGGILTIGCTQMALKGPIGATLVLKKLDCKETGVHGVIGQGHPKFEEFSDLLDFARREGFFRVFP